VDELTLPHKYKLQLSIQGTSSAAAASAQGAGANPASLLHDWTLTIKQIAHNTKIDDLIFVLK
jgi:hypothetical protein